MVDLSHRRFVVLALAVLLLALSVQAMISDDAEGDTPTRALPSRINLSNAVPYHMAVSQDLTGEAGLSMVFDDHGPYIMQQDIRNVTKGILGSGVADVEELIRAAHYSSNFFTSQKGYRERPLGYGGFMYDWSDDERNPSPRFDMRFADLYQAMAEGHPILCYMYLDMPPDLNPNPQPPDPNNPQPPEPKVTPEDLAALDKVWRLVVGYDTNQGSNGVLIVHDPLPAGTGYLGGRAKTITRENFDKLWNVYELEDQRISTHRIGMTAAPWKLNDLEHPASVEAGTDFTISVNITYWAPSVMVGVDVSDPRAELVIPADYSYVEGKRVTSLSIMGPTTYESVEWTIRAPDRAYAGQDWNFILNATGNVTVVSPAHHDRIGETAFFEVETYGYLNHPPTITSSLVDPEVIPDDGSVQPLIASAVEDEDGNLQSVTVDLSSVGGSSQQRMYDDGTNGDETSGDSIYSYRIRKKLQMGEHTFTVTAKDTRGGMDMDNVTLIVEDAALFTNAPDIVDKGVFPMGIPNDGFTTSVIWAVVDDDEGDLERVEADLSEVGGESDARMFDDGTSGDLFADDGNYSLEFTVGPEVELSIYQVGITAYDRAGHETSAKTWVDVILPPVPPFIIGVSPMPDEVPNDGKTPVTLTAAVEDDNGDLERVWVDLTPVKGPQFAYMKDDGIYPDITEDDGTWTIEFTVGRSVSEGLKGKIDVTAEDSAGLTYTASFSLKVLRANTPPEIMNYNITASDGIARTEFTEGETVNIKVQVQDDDGDELTVSVDLSEMGGSGIELDDADGDGWFEGSFRIPVNTSGSSYNVTITVSDPDGASDSIRIRIGVRESETASKGSSLSSGTILLLSLGGFAVLLILVLVFMFGRKKTAPTPPGGYGRYRQPGPPGPYGRPSGAAALR